MLETKDKPLLTVTTAPSTSAANTSGNSTTVVKPSSPITTNQTEEIEPKKFKLCKIVGYWVLFLAFDFKTNLFV